MNGWSEYVAGVAQLDAVRREAAEAVAAQEKAAELARTELGTVRQRIALQRSRLSDMAVRHTKVAPLIEPLTEERGAATAIVASVTSDPTPGINAALQGARATLDAADATLSGAIGAPVASGPLPDWPAAVRNGLVYGWYALLALIALVVISGFAGDSVQARLVLDFFAIVVPAGALLVGWLSVTLLFGRNRGPGPRRSSNLLLGAAICVWPMIIGFVLSLV
jgi:hypothetical protein